jgi:hypothetical protein
LMSSSGAACEELEQGWEIFVCGKVGAVRIADKWVTHDCCPIINRQLHLSIDQELSPEGTKGLWDLQHTRQAVRPQICDHLADPCANVIARDCDTRASKEKLLTSKLVVGAGCGQIGDKLVTTYKQVVRTTAEKYEMRNEKGDAHSKAEYTARGG